MRRKRVRSDYDLEANAQIVRRDPIAGRVGRIYSRDQISKAEQKIVPWYRGSKDENRDRL
jgi:hypothetical protein